MEENTKKETVKVRALKKHWFRGEVREKGDVFSVTEQEASELEVLEFAHADIPELTAGGNNGSPSEDPPQPPEDSPGQSAAGTGEKPTKTSKPK